MPKQRGSKSGKSEEKYWAQRANAYNKLRWVGKSTCIAALLDVANLTKKDTVLDVGCGTGVLFPYLQGTGAKVYGLDISEAMAAQSAVKGVPIVIQDIRKPFQLDLKPTVIIARMMLHHITIGLDTALKNLYNILSPKGRLIVCEGVPPNDTPRMAEWYAQMFKLKEDRLCFNEAKLTKLLRSAGFCKISTQEHIDPKFDITNWAEHSCVSEKDAQKVIEAHVYATDAIKDAYHMVFDYDKIFARTKTLIMSGTKRG